MIACDTFYQILVYLASLKEIKRNHPVLFLHLMAAIGSLYSNFDEFSRERHIWYSIIISLWAKRECTDNKIQLLL